MRRTWEKLISLASSNVGLKLLSVALALGLWLAGQRDAERAVEVPVAFSNIPSDLMVIDNRVDYVVLRVVGPRTLVSTIGPEDLKLTVDLNGARPGGSSFPLSPSSFHAPRGVRIARISSSAIHVRLEPVAERVLPVLVRFTGKPPQGYRVAETEVKPESVTVRGPASEVRRMTSAETVPIELEGLRAPLLCEVRISADGRSVSFSPNRVAISVKMEEERLTRELSRVEVRAKGFAGAYHVSPRTVYLRLAGPKHILKELKVGTDQVYLELKGLSPGEHVVILSFQLPEKVEVLEQKPERFKVRIPAPKS